jgi:hypothetical protein
LLLLVIVLPLAPATAPAPEVEAPVDRFPVKEDEELEGPLLALAAERESELDWPPLPPAPPLPPRAVAAELLALLLRTSTGPVEEEETLLPPVLVELLETGPVAALVGPVATETGPVAALTGPVAAEA